MTTTTDDHKARAREVLAQHDCMAAKKLKVRKRVSLPWRWLLERLIATALAEAEARALERAINAAEVEPEAPGPMPEAMIPIVLADPETAMRAAVTSTKRNIGNRIRALTQPASKGGGDEADDA